MSNDNSTAMLLSLAPPRTRAIYGRWVKGESIGALGARYGISKQRIQQVLNSVGVRSSKQPFAPNLAKPDPERPYTSRGFMQPHPPYPVLGPARCQGCGTRVWYAHGTTRESWNGAVIRGLLRWREQHGRIHPVCAA